MTDNRENFTQPFIHCFGQVTSCMDVAFELVGLGRLAEWESVLARSQTAGRGQMRRKWNSEDGNMFAALRLPAEAPFNTIAAPVVMGALCANIMRGFGCPIFLKWPNDMVLDNDHGVAKIAGILLEEKDGVVIAGIGINILSSPELEEMRVDAAIPATSMACACIGTKLPKPFELWNSLVKHIYSVYKNGPVISKIWKNLAEDLLVWRHEPVTHRDGDVATRGVLLGISEEGGLLIQTETGIVEKQTGTLVGPDGIQGKEMSTSRQ